VGKIEGLTDGDIVGIVEGLLDGLVDGTALDIDIDEFDILVQSLP
jgi:hypothetical protein